MPEWTDGDWKHGHDLTRRSIAHYDGIVTDLEQQLARARRDREGQVQVLLDSLTKYANWLGADRESRNEDGCGQHCDMSDHFEPHANCCHNHRCRESRNEPSRNEGDRDG